MITPYNQEDKNWGSMKLGDCNLTIRQDGCFLCSLSMLANKLPPYVNRILLDGSGYSDGCEINSPRAAELLKLDYDGRSSTAPDYPCVAETNNFAPKYPSHFFVWLGNNQIIDPLGGQQKTNPYHIVSFRLFKQINSNDMTKEEVQELLKDYVKRDIRLNFEPKDGSCWLTGNSKKYKMGTAPDDWLFLANMMAGEQMNDAERNFPQSYNRKEVL